MSSKTSWRPSWIAGSSDYLPSLLLPNGKRIPGLKIDHPRQLALMHALVRFANIAAANTFTTQELYPHTLKALGCTPDD
jgi:hypothetical protein